MPLLICYDCHNEEYPDLAKEWVYPCEECAEEFVAKHYAENGHEISAMRLEPAHRILKLFR